MGYMDNFDMHRLLGTLGLVYMMIFLVACSTPGMQVYSEAETAAAGLNYKGVEEYQIGSGDSIQVSVWRHPDLGITVPVRPDGKISVPLIGEVAAGGKAPQMVAEEITARMSEYIRDPNVSVIVMEMNSHEYLTRVRVTGAVRAPTSMAHRRGMTVLDLILVAGGVTEFAAADRTRLYRKVDEGTHVYSIRLDKILKDGDLNTNLALVPGDVVTVPESIF